METFKGHQSFQDVHLIMNQITDMQQHTMDMTQQYFTFSDTLIGLVTEPQPADRKSVNVLPPSFSH